MTDRVTLKKKENKQSKDVKEKRVNGEWSGGSRSLVGTRERNEIYRSFLKEIPSGAFMSIYQYGRRRRRFGSEGRYAFSLL